MMKSRNLLLAVVVLAATAATLWAALAPHRTATLAYVAVAGNNHVQVIDLGTGETLRKIYSGATPWRLVASPDRERLWVQHWYSGTTAVINLHDHEVAAVLPVRGPGRFSADGSQFLSFSWPGSALDVVDAKSFERVRETVTEINKVYDLAPDPDGQTLHLVQFDPEAKGPHERYAYVASYPWREQDPSRATPVSQRTGRSPASVQTLRTGPFLITADRGTNGLTLLNKLGDGRAVPACPAPQAVVLSPQETRMAVLCWRGEGERQSQLLVYKTDFTARPWPAITQTGTATVAGGLVAGAFSPKGDRLYAVDRTGGRLLEADSETLELLRDITIGDVPVDVAVVELPQTSRDRAAKEGRARQRLKEILARLPRPAAPSDLTWIETAAWREPAGAKDPAPVPPPSRQRVAFHPPDRLRVESEDGGLRLAAGGHSTAVDPTGRFWVTPRQEMVSLLWGLAAVPVDEAVRLLAGDVPGSPWLRGGLAVDLVVDVKDPGGARSVLIGALRPGERVSQLWIDAETGRPASLVEQFPVFRARGHEGSGFGGLVETKLYDARELAPGLWMPARLERVFDGRATQDVRLEGITAGRQLPESAFDLARLGGIPARPPQPVPAVAVPILSHPYLEGPGQPHPPYNSNPPTSGPRLPWIADWGVHAVPVPLELQTHNLEHGGVAIQYNCPEGCPDVVERLETLARTRDFVLVAPYPLMDPGIALTAWGRIEHLRSFDEARVLAFLDAYAGRDHHEAGASGEAQQMARAH